MAGSDHAEVPSGERPPGSSPVAGPSRTVSLPEDALELLVTGCAGITEARQQ